MCAQLQPHFQHTRGIAVSSVMGGRNYTVIALRINLAPFAKVPRCPTKFNLRNLQGRLVNGPET